MCDRFTTEDGRQAATKGWAAVGMGEMSVGRTATKDDGDLGTINGNGIRARDLGAGGRLALAVEAVDGDLCSCWAAGHCPPMTDLRLIWKIGKRPSLLTVSAAHDPR